MHRSAHQYYENRPEECIDQENIHYEEEELVEDYWINLCLAEFWSKYEIVYGKVQAPKKGKTRLIPLKNKDGFIRRRSEMAVLRYYLNYENDEDLARGLLILFMPFRDEMVEIHSKDVKQVLFDSRNLVERKRRIFEKYKTMTDLISTIQTDIEANVENIDGEEDGSDEVETTQLEDIDRDLREG